MADRPSLSEFFLQMALSTLRALDESLLIMMCDIFSTGYYGASRAIEGLLTQHQSPLTSFRDARPIKVSLKGQNGHINGSTNALPTVRQIITQTEMHA